MAGAMTMLAWGGVVYGSSYDKAGQAQYYREQIKWGTDYLLKAHVAPFELYGQVIFQHRVRFKFQLPICYLYRVLGVFQPIYNLILTTLDLLTII